MKSFLKDRRGNTVIIQSPNMLIVLWAAISLGNMLSSWNDIALNVIADMLLFAWAYLELTRGVSRFRMVLGGVILTYLVVKQLI